MRIGIHVSNATRKGATQPDTLAQAIAELTSHLAEVYPHARIEIGYGIPDNVQVTRIVPRLSVYQDGGRFYANDSGAPIFTSPHKVPDGDLHAASRARAQFAQWARDTHGVSPENISYL